MPKKKTFTLDGVGTQPKKLTAKEMSLFFPDNKKKTKKKERKINGGGKK